ncbi:MAG TPA: tetratricopeptide repeat protein [bacterium]|nr:tetratricopeptide repeat protein [bacterium]
MVSENPREAPDAGEAAPQDAPAEAAPAEQTAAESVASADTDTLESSEPGVQPGLLSRLNPLRMFRRHSVENYISEGKDLLENGSMAQATVAFQKALELDSHCTAAYRGLGKVFYKKGGRSNLETALKHYQEAIKQNPKEPDLYAITAKIYDTLGKRKEATLERKKFVIVRALDADARNPVANNNMGILFLQQGRMDEALEYFNRAVQSDRRYDVAYRNLAAAYFQMAKQAPDSDKKADYNSKARESIQKAMEIAPAVPTLMAHARILMMDGNLEDVLAVLEKVDQMAPANPDVYHMMKMAFEGLGRFEEAKSAQESYLVFKQKAAPAPPTE